MKLNRQIILVLLLSFAGVIQSACLCAQALRVESVSAEQFDLSASKDSRRDNNGDFCALVKVSFARLGAEFEGNVIGNVDYKAGEYWVYMSKGTKFLKIKHPDFGSQMIYFDKIRTGGAEPELPYNFVGPLMPKATYMVRIGGVVNTTAEHEKQKVTFKVTPSGAVLAVDGKEYDTTSGAIDIMLPIGEHSYYVYSPGYLSQGSKFVVFENNDNKQTIVLETDSGRSPGRASNSELSTTNPTGTSSGRIGNSPSSQTDAASAKARAAVAKAKADVDNPKKATEYATWAKYGQALLDAYISSAGNAWLNATKAEVQLILGNDKPVSTEVVQLPSGTFEKEVYATRNYYYTDGVLSFIEITKPVIPDALSLAAEAYAEAAKRDLKGAKAKELNAAFSTIAAKFTEDAYASYFLGDFASASKNFEDAARVAAMAPAARVDSNAVYNAGFTAWLSGNHPRALKFFTRCLEIGYLMDGDVYAKLADVFEKAGNPEKALEYLEEGFQKFPQNQGILVGLINNYLSNGNGNTDRLFVLLGKAKKNEPNNASLYYVEGNIYSQLGKIDEAVAAYDQCSVIDPGYVFGFIGKGQMFYNEAVKYVEEAQEADDQHYLALVAKADAALKKCVEPFEIAYEKLTDDATKLAVAEYLKLACYRLSSDSPWYEAKYKIYDKILTENRNR